MVSRGCGLGGETEEPRGRGLREWGWRPPMGGLLGGAQAAIGYGGTEEAGDSGIEARSRSQLQVLSPREALDRRAAVAAVTAAAAARAIAWKLKP